MNTSVTIPLAPLEHPAMDYAYLRREGIALLEQLGGQMWTDFNAHDPGITILEQLCYVITDLAYRINYDIKDLLSSGAEKPYDSLYSPAQILTTKPVTLQDLRKLIIDVAGVKNAWVEPVNSLEVDTGTETAIAYDRSEHALYLTAAAESTAYRQNLMLKGLYRVYIQTDSEQSSSTLSPDINRKLQTCRSLGEDFLPPVFLQKQAIIVHATIEITEVTNPELLLASIYHAVIQAISPSIRFYSLSEMLAKGKPIDDIFDGPTLAHGFIDNLELNSFQRKVALRSSDLLQEIMAITGVNFVRELKLECNGKREDWYLKLDAGSTPFLDVIATLSNSTIVLTRAGIDVQLEPEKVQEHLAQLQEKDKKILDKRDLDIQLATGQERELEQYHSFQHQFPAVYGIGAMGLPNSSSPERQAQSKQLKAYLMFFDQLLANQFAQLANAKDLFSFYASTPMTYFSQLINDPTLGLDDIRKSRDSADLQFNTRHASPTNEDIERKNRFLNHLLARFGEQFTDLQYANLNKSELISHKSAFLQAYETLGAARGCGFDASQGYHKLNNTSGLEQRIRHKLGIANDPALDIVMLDAKAAGSFHLLEHILLRPHIIDNQQRPQSVGFGLSTAFMALADTQLKDPYSHQISIVLPDWIERFNQPAFQQLIIKTLREEAPAHIHLNILWFNPAQMQVFETAQQDWLNSPNQLKQRDARDQLVKLLGIGTAYPLIDLPLEYAGTVVFGTAAVIKIVSAQLGVNYQLCDEDGYPVTSKNKSIEFLVVSKEAADSALLKTPPINKDITFTVLATTQLATGAKLEVYLTKQVEIKAGIDTQLGVDFAVQQDQIVKKTKILINYGAIVKVTIANSQEGISYKLIAGNKDLSLAVKGNTQTITLVSSVLNEYDDIDVSVQAYRTTDSTVSTQLDTKLSILVRPNRAVAIITQKSIIDYQNASTLTLVAAQPNVQYRLYQRDILLTEYPVIPAAGYKTDQFNNLAIQVQVDDETIPAGFSLVGTFMKSSDTELSITTGKLLEDTLFMVQASKINHLADAELNPLLTRQLSQLLVLLVKPNPAPDVSVEKATLRNGELGLVKLSGTQKGIAYQLSEGNKAINPPGYHQTDRGLESARLEVDFVVGEQGSVSVLLPTGAIIKTTQFTILASKIVTGVSVQLNAIAEIKVAP